MRKLPLLWTILFLSLSLFLFAQTKIQVQETIDAYDEIMGLSKNILGIPNIFYNSNDTVIRALNLNIDKKVTIRQAVFDLSKAVFIDEDNRIYDKAMMAVTEYDAKNFVAAPMDFGFYYDSTNNGIFVSGGLFNIHFFSKEGLLNLKEGSFISVEYPIGKLTSQTLSNMNIYSYDEYAKKWVYESKPSIETVGGQRVFRFRVTHLSFWNIDAPITEHACLRGKVSIKGVREKIPVRVIASGIDYQGNSVRMVTNGDYFEIDVKQNSRVNLYAVSSNRWGGMKENIRVWDKIGSSRADKMIYDIENTVIYGRNSIRWADKRRGEDIWEISTNQYKNTWGNQRSTIGYFEGMGGRILAMQKLSNWINPFYYINTNIALTNLVYRFILETPALSNRMVTNTNVYLTDSDGYFLSDHMYRGEVRQNVHELKVGNWLGYFYLVIDSKSLTNTTVVNEKMDVGEIILNVEDYRKIDNQY